MLLTRGDAFVSYPSLAERGFDRGDVLPFATDEEAGPRLLFADGTQSTYLADMSGDGLSDLVRIRNGSVAVWPNLGYGRFGAKVEMDNAPLFAPADARITMHCVEEITSVFSVYHVFDGDKNRT